ncbi:hypothetical protein Micbo1qcDRAFT_179393 [Microdochium bolleyi]|uniref:Uncharacterized protein n=1 Tax=Microdochium bolleyi TaxID=196109 RepID=A0A136IQE4_9PEZI|nr:hypothetical protein Micbo1qcDRAFT_179393 [Microdochium bolleyi]
MHHALVLGSGMEHGVITTRGRIANLIMPAWRMLEGAGTAVMLQLLAGSNTCYHLCPDNTAARRLVADFDFRGVAAAPPDEVLGTSQAETRYLLGIGSALSSLGNFALRKEQAGAKNQPAAEQYQERHSAAEPKPRPKRPRVYTTEPVRSIGVAEPTPKLQRTCTRPWLHSS